MNILKAADVGATHILVVSTDEHKDMFEDIGYDLWLETKSQEFRDNYKMSEEKIAQTVLPDSVKVLKVSPSRKLPVRLLDNDMDRLRETIKNGYEDCLKHGALQQFLSEMHF